MRKILLILLLTLPQFTYASEFYIGINIGNRLGTIFGYRIDDEHSIEANFGGLLHNIFHGIALKRYRSPTSNEYVVIGYYGFNADHPSMRDGAVDVTGFAMGLGYSNRNNNSKWTYPIELGASMNHSSEEGGWRPNPYFGLGALYGEAK